MVSTFESCSGLYENKHMRIPFLERLFSKPVQTEPAATPKEMTAPPIKTGIAASRDSFESAPQSTTGNLFAPSNLKPGQDSSSEQKSDDVIIGFEPGEIRSPYVVGNLWNSQDTPPASAESDSDSDKDSNKKNRD